MLILPGHHSQKTKTSSFRVADQAGITNLDDTECLNQAIGKNEDIKPVKGGTHPVEVDQSHIAQDEERFGTAPKGGGLNVNQYEFDEYGTELGREARVWKTYVKESDRYDGEKVEEWNKSLDVILIFAALFSAISTAFVIESSKKLQPDPSETTSQTLSLISQTLLFIANNSQPPTFNASNQVIDEIFKPSYSAICVNILWFLSLSLSVAVSLIAMLAKEWCYRFMSGRTGDMCSQAKRRQQRWEGLERWKMEEVLMFLPSLIHLALFLFAVGLCIYLWDMHFGVAIPVAIITLLTLGIYIASTLLPLFYRLCPYNTTASRFITSVFNRFASKTGAKGTHSPEQDITTSKALCWLIGECEDPRSIDVALQAIAGADSNLPLEPLKKCHADAMICQRLTAGSSYPTTYETVFELYARAFAVLQPPTNEQGEGKGGYNHANELRRKIRDLQVMTERVVADLLVTQELLPTQDNLLALRIGSTAPPYCLQVLNYEPKDQALESLNSAIDLFGRCLEDMRRIHPAALHSLVVGTAMLLACSPIHSNKPVAGSYIFRLLRHLVRVPPSTFSYYLNQQRKNYVGLLLGVFTVSQNDYPGWTHPAPLGHTARAERAVEVVAHYASTRYVSTVEKIPKGVAMNIALLELIIHSKEYRLAPHDFDFAVQEIRPMFGGSVRGIYTLPSRFSLAQLTMDALNAKILGAYDEIVATESSIKAHLGVLFKTYDQSVGATPPRVYIFVLECICLVPSICSTLDIYCGVHTPFLFLLDILSPPESSDELVDIFINRNVASTIYNAMKSHDTDIEMLGMRQFFIFARIFMPNRRGARLSESSKRLLSSLFRSEECCNPFQRMCSEVPAWGRRLEKQRALLRAAILLQKRFSKYPETPLERLRRVARADAYVRNAPEAAPVHSFFEPPRRDAIMAL